MKYTNKIIAGLALLAIAPLSYASNLSVESIVPVDANTLKVTLSENPNLPQGDIKGEVTVMTDVSLRGAAKSLDSENSVELMLGEDLLPNTSYSLLNISGADGSIDFVTSADVEGFTAENPNVSTEQNIASIEVLDPQTLVLTYVNPISATNFSYKLLAESKVTSITKENYDIPELTLSVEPPLVSNKDYILMVVELQDVDGNYLEFDTGIYDFNSGDVPASEQMDMTTTSDKMSANMDETVAPQDESNIDMNAATDENVTTASDNETGNIEEVAATATVTPDTGAETWVLVLATLFINTFYYFARRKNKIAL